MLVVCSRMLGSPALDPLTYINAGHFHSCRWHIRWHHNNEVCLSVLFSQTSSELSPKSRQQSAVRFLQKTTSISLQPPHLPPVLSCPVTLTHLVLFESKHVHVCLMFDFDWVLGNISFRKQHCTSRLKHCLKNKTKKRQISFLKDESDSLLYSYHIYTAAATKTFVLQP